MACAIWENWLLLFLYDIDDEEIEEDVFCFGNFRVSFQKKLLDASRLESTYNYFLRLLSMFYCLNVGCAGTPALPPLCVNDLH